MIGRSQSANIPVSWSIGRCVERIHSLQADVSLTTSFARRPTSHRAAWCADRGIGTVAELVAEVRDAGDHRRRCVTTEAFV